jgi:predicted nuclease of restriction endonuclease-like RecB superfamily
MLTGDLIRATRRKGVIFPRYINTGNADLRAIASDLVGIFEDAASANPSPRRAELDEAIADRVGHRQDPLLFRGFCKLLWDRCNFDVETTHPPEEVRHQLFLAAAQSPVRRAPGRDWAAARHEIVSAAAADLEMSADDVNEVMYADLEANQRLQSYKALTAEQLLDRYNMSLAQAVLLRATRLRIALPSARVGAYRQLFRALKFNQLIHTVRGVPGVGYLIEVDGPLSLFANAGRYGLAMARFLPTLALLDEWQLEADLVWGKGRSECTFRVDHKSGLKSHLKKRGQYITQEQEWFEERFKKRPGAWKMSRSARILRSRAGDVVVPDIELINSETGLVAYLEIIGFWRAGSLQKRLDQLEDSAFDNLILAVSSRLAGERKADPPKHPRIVWFKQIIPAKRVLEALEALEAL